ncbi:hypothetical protein PR048_011357 [Dryococelus australis]|uniref:RNA-directed DNA polymerase n=1 Tax=Dryococelus australis TaxID=614101 RepID=A0ABQ9HLD4_9NEOP|nr:hypothetical protein PR048_011357 [Dryococelus australis]
MSIFGPKKGIPTMAASQLQRWAIFLSGFTYSIRLVYSKGNRADFLSQLPLNHVVPSSIEDDNTLYIHFINSEVPIITVQELANVSRQDGILKKVIKYVKYGWPDKQLPEVFVPYSNRLAIPNKLRNVLLSDLHSTHMDMVKSKSLAQSYFWWPSLDKEIESHTIITEPSKAELSLWAWPSGPNKRLHADFCGPIQCKMFLIILDAYSKWVDLFPMENITSSKTIIGFRQYFCSSNITTAVHTPHSNGAAENSVKTFKASFKKQLWQGENSTKAVQAFLYMYRATPHTTTEYSPAELQMGRQLRTRFNLLIPSRDIVVEKTRSQRIKTFM